MKMKEFGREENEVDVLDMEILLIGIGCCSHDVLHSQLLHIHHAFLLTHPIHVHLHRLAHALFSVQPAHLHNPGLGLPSSIMNSLLHHLSFRQGAEALAVNGGLVDEEVVAAIVRGDEAIAFGAVEPLHLAKLLWSSASHGANSLTPLSLSFSLSLSLSLSLSVFLQRS